MTLELRIDGQEVAEEEPRKILTFAFEQREEGLTVVAKEEDGDSWPVVAITGEGKLKRFAELDDIGLKLTDSGKILMLRD